MKKYPKVRAVGHKEIASLFDGPVVIQEKIDGSNFGFGRDADGILFAVSRTQDLSFSNPEKLFAPALEYVKSIEDRIPVGTLHRCEFLAKPKHNVLAYERVPTNYLIMFDFEVILSSGVILAEESRQSLEIAASTLGIEPVREILRGDVNSADARAWFIEKWSKEESQLGGPAMEGVVIKNYGRFTPDGSILLGKWVRDEFKEQHRHASLANRTDPVEVIGAKFGGPARWQKAVQRLTEVGERTNSPEDIGKLMGLVRKDVEEECAEEIKEALWKHYRKNVIGGSTKGLAEWYKAKL